MKTKIYGTIGPACFDYDTLVRLLKKGMTGIRINLSHMNLSEAVNWIENIHGAWNQVFRGETKCDSSDMEILMDLRGPELRIGKLQAHRMLEEGDILSLIAEGKNNLFDPTEIPIPEAILPYLTEGQEVIIDDGKLALQVMEQNANVIECRVVRGGLLKSGKSIALLGKEVHMPTLTDSDLANIAVAKQYGITGVMLPFVRGKEDLQNLKQALKDADAPDIKVFAKIENETGVSKIAELIPECDEIVIARGDLGNAIPLWRLPVVQADLAALCQTEQKSFMVVTQMLASMEHASVPTRAEVSDIFRAIVEGAASVMLTGETAAGEFPVEAMDYLVRTVREAEAYRDKKKGTLALTE